MPFLVGFRKGYKESASFGRKNVIEDFDVAMGIVLSYGCARKL